MLRQNNRINTHMSNECFNCTLPDCDEANPNCLLWQNKTKPGTTYYLRHKDESLFRKNRYEIKKRWRKTISGHESMRKSCKKYRDENHDKVRGIEIASYHRCHSDRSEVNIPILSVR